MAQMFREKRDSSVEPTFNIVLNNDVTHGCKVIDQAFDAVFIHVHSYRECFGFWMPVSTYETLKDGYVKLGKNAPINQWNYNKKIYRY